MRQAMQTQQRTNANCGKNYVCLLIPICIFLSIALFEIYYFCSNNTRVLIPAPTNANIKIRSDNIIEFDSSFADNIPSFTNESRFDFKINEQFFENLYKNNKNHSINILLIGASHGGSDPIQIPAIHSAKPQK